MFAYVLKRLLAAVPVMAVVAIVVFALLRFAPGDPALILAGDLATPEQVAQIRESLGLSRPLPAQFLGWASAVLTGEFGMSIISNQPVLKLIGDRIGVTITLALSTIATSVLVAIPLGVLAAWRHGTWIDRASMALSVGGFSIPVFVLGYLFVYVFAMTLGGLPVQGWGSSSGGLLSYARHLVLPTLTLSIIYVALIARMVRASMLDVLHEDYVRTARAKGATERTVLFRHALRNAAVPTLSIIGVGLTLLLSGVVVTESVFNLPGLGRLTVDAILARDYPVIQAVILVFSGMYVVINLLIDVSYTFFDPRIRY
jgi:peptide/nickel transport system permease protein